METLIKADDHLALWAFIMVAATAAICIEQRYKWASKIPGAVVILPLLMDRISRIKCSSMAAYRRWLDEAFHGCKTTANEWHGLQHRSNY